MINLKLPVAVLAILLIFGCERDPLLMNESGNLVPKTVDEDTSLPSIDVNGIKLHAEAFGNPNGPMIVVLHGGPGQDYRSLLNIKEFANQGYRVVFYDQRGAGLSQRVPYASYNGEEMYDDLKGVIAYYKTSPTQKVFLLGHSWGAMLAAAYINRYPTAIAGAVIAEPGGLIWKDVEDYVGRANSFKYLGEGLNDAVYMEQFITGRQNDHATLDYKHLLWAAANQPEDSPTGIEGNLPRWRVGAVTFHAYIAMGKEKHLDWVSNLNKYTTKIMFVYSENNKAYGRSHALKVSSAFPNVELFETLDAGHEMLSFKKGWDNTYPAMLQYFNSLK